MDVNNRTGNTNQLRVILRVEEIVTEIRFLHAVNILSDNRIPAADTAESSFFEIILHL